MLSTKGPCPNLFLLCTTSAALFSPLSFNKDGAGKRGCCQIQLTPASKGTVSVRCQLAPPQTAVRPPWLLGQVHWEGAAGRIQMAQVKSPEAKVTPGSSWQCGGSGEEWGVCSSLCGVSGCPASHPQHPQSLQLPSPLLASNSLLSVSQCLHLPASKGGCSQVCRMGPWPRAGSQNPS